MATGTDLKQISKAREKTASILIDAGDWVMAAYMLGYALECALKAAICKHLRLAAYPDNLKHDKIRAFFSTHNFDQLLIVSGLQDIFGPNGDPNSFQEWSDFTVEFSGDWTGMRYDTQTVKKFDEAKVKAMHGNLTNPTTGILTVIRRRRRW